MGLFSKLAKGVGKALKSVGSALKKAAPTLVSSFVPGAGGLSAAGGAFDLSQLSPLQQLGTVQSASGGFDLGGVLQAGLGAALGSAADQLTPRPHQVAPGTIPTNAAQQGSSSIVPLVALGLAALFFLR